MIDKTKVRGRLLKLSSSKVSIAKLNRTDAKMEAFAAVITILDSVFIFLFLSYRIQVLAKY